ncbi:MAG: tetratricopeptide repeat protein [Xenococcaceae cyanobacterium]
MQESLNNSPETNNNQETLEMVAVYGSIAGSVAAVILSVMNLNPVAFATASIPLSASAFLNFKNRKELVKNYLESQAKQDNAIESLQQTQANHISTLESHTSLISDRGISIVKLTEENNFQHKAIETHSSEIEEIKKATGELKRVQKEIETSLQTMENLEILSAQANSYTEQFYYKRGSIEQRFGNAHKAIDDFSEAIRLNPKNVNAYYNRGILRSQFGEKQRAVDDLRAAAKFYFDRGDLENYEQAKSLSLSIHAIETEAEEPTKASTKQGDKMLLANLFE